MSRISKDEWFLEIAKVVALRGTCARRKVGCVLADQHGRILSTGYNGVARGMVHCTAVPCKGVGMRSGTGLDLCEAVHAEQNAILTCRSPDEIHTCYVTTSPCVSCLKLLLNSPCQRIVFGEQYADTNAAALWRKAGRNWDYLHVAH